MFLSRIELDSRKAETRRALSSPQVLHAAVEGCFEKEQPGRKLWRLDKLGGRLYLLLLSPNKPDFTSFAAQFCALNIVGESKDYAVMLARLNEGQRLGFRLRANPVHSVRSKDGSHGKRGKIYAHVTVEQQRGWLVKRAESCGFIVREDDFDVVERGQMRFRRKSGEKSVEIGYAIFEGILEITNVEQFTEALIQGIGRAKAYGCGLMTVANVAGVR